MSTDLIQSLPAVVVALDSHGNIEATSDDFSSWCQMSVQLGESISNALEEDVYLSLKEPISKAINGDYMELSLTHL